MIVVVILASVCVHVVWCRRRRRVVARWLQKSGAPPSHLGVDGRNLPHIRVGKDSTPSKK